MIDIRALRDDPDAVKAALARRGVDAAEVDAVVEADAAWRVSNARAEDLRREVKRRLALLSEDSPFSLPARAWAVRGIVPGHR